MATCIEALTYNQEENNHKVTQMAVAHRALKNFLWGLLALALLASYYSVTVPAHDDRVERIKANQELLDLLRGPQGVPGLPCVGTTQPPAASSKDARRTK
jgi:hypothetical protein